MHDQIKRVSMYRMEGYKLQKLDNLQIFSISVHSD